MAKFYSCVDGCTGCCPGGTYTIGKNRFSDLPWHVEATIGDVYRAFLFGNPRSLPMSEIARARFEYLGHSPFDQLATPDEMNEEAVARYAHVLDPTRPYGLELFIFGPFARDPCIQLNGNGCRGHGTVVKLVVCAGEPEGWLRYVRFMTPSKRPKRDKLPCTWGADLDPAEYGRALELEVIRLKEEEISGSIFPVVQLPHWSNHRRYVRQAELNGERRREVEERLEEALAALDRPEKRTWEGEIVATTKRYADAMGIELARGFLR